MSRRHTVLSSEALKAARTSDLRSEWLQDHEDAVAAFQEAALRDPSHAQAWFLLGISLSALDAHERAIAAFTRVTQLRPGDTTAAVHRLCSLACCCRPTWSSVRSCSGPRR